MRTLFTAILLLTLAPAASADIVVGCLLDGTKVPPIVVTLRGPDGTPLGRYNSTIDDRLRLPTHMQKPLPDGSFYVKYNGEDRREDYGRSVQMITIHFKFDGPLKAQALHAAGDVVNVPVNGQRPVQLWTGTAAYFTVFGTINDALPNTEDCFWFCDVPIEWVLDTEVATETSSFGRIKALY